MMPGMLEALERAMENQKREYAILEKKAQIADYLLATIRAERNRWAIHPKLLTLANELRESLKKVEEENQPLT